ncbi:hypothetical protein QTP70_032324, partial [Hemibagrus guttatus]
MPHSNKLIHSFIVYRLYDLFSGNLCLSQASLGIKAGYTLDGVPTHCRAHTHTLSFTHTITQFRDANQPTMHVFGLGEETPEARGEHAKSTHTAEAGIEP